MKTITTNTKVLKRRISKRNVVKLFSKLSLFSYIDENLNVVYAPALDLFGYGHDEREAKESFEINLAEYIDFTHKNNTLEKDLMKYGWFIDKKKNKINSPELTSLLDKNEILKDVIDRKVFKKFYLNVPFPSIV